MARFHPLQIHSCVADQILFLKKHTWIERLSVEQFSKKQISGSSYIYVCSPHTCKSQYIFMF